MGHPTVTTYYSVVLKLSENKNQQEPLKTEEEIVFLPETNNKSNGNGITTTHTIGPEKATIMGTKTAPVDDEKRIKTRQEEVQKQGRSGE